MKKDIEWKAIQSLCVDKYRISEFANEPKKIEDKVYATPDRAERLRNIPVAGGWHRVLYSNKRKSYWILEIEGPDHGVRFYGPFKGDPERL